MRNILDSTRSRCSEGCLSSSEPYLAGLLCVPKLDPNVLVMKSHYSSRHRHIRFGAGWASPTTMMWSRHSRRMDPISRSAKPFCQGDRGAIGLSRTPIARIRWITTEPKTRSRSRITYPGAESHGNASVIWRAIQSAVGLFVSLIQTSSRRSSRTMMKP